MNKSNLFSLDEVLGSSWETFKKSPLKIIGFFLLLFFLTILNAVLFPSLLSGLGDSLLIALILQIESWIVGSLIEIAFIIFTLNLLSTKKTSFRTKLTDVRLLLKVIAGSLLSTLIILGGFILLIIPGIYFAFRMWLVTYYIVDQGDGPVEAIKKSWKNTKGHFFSLLGLSLVLLLINLFGLLVLVVGLLVTIPVTYIATTWVYKKLSQHNS